MSSGNLELERIDKFYGVDRSGVHAVKDLSMQVHSGEIVALLGSSGCGKTSILRMIAGFEAVSSGAIRINGREIHRLQPFRRHVAMAFEGYSLYPPLTVRENIAFALTAAKLPKSEISSKVDHMATLLELDDILDRYPVSISGGQQQRASLARALVRDADVHLLDEPMGQLEPQLRALLRGRIKHFIKEQGLTAILVTHDQTEANALADRIAVMEDGSLQQFDSPDRIKECPANLFTGTFVGEPPMNIFDATIESDENHVHFRLSRDVLLSYSKSEFGKSLAERIIASKELIVGFRPYAAKRGATGCSIIITANQWLGDQSHIAAKLAGSTLILVEHDRAAVAEGDLIKVSVAAENLHLFNASTGNAIAHGCQPA